MPRGTGDDEEDWGFVTVPPRGRGSRSSDGREAPGADWRACTARLERLDAELRLLAAASCASSSESARCVQACRESIEGKARRLVPDMRAHLFGSQAVGMATLASDIDVVLLSPTRYLEQAPWGMKETAESDKVVFLQELARTLTPSPFARVEVIGHASVPIIKGTTEHGVHCDISVGRENGLRSCDIMRRSLSEIAELRPLVVFLKLLLKERGLNQVFTGGLSSYAVFHLVLSFLHSQSSPPTAPQPHEEAGANRSSRAGAFPHFVNSPGTNSQKYSIQRLYIAKILGH